MTTKASTVYGNSSGGVRPNGLQGFLFGISVSAPVNGVGSSVISGVNISTGLVTCLSLSGRFVINSLVLQNIDIAANPLRIVLEIDGVTIADSTQAGSTIPTAQVIGYPISCQSSLVLKAQKPAATSVTVSYNAISAL